jgi:hypothetical protein
MHWRHDREGAIQVAVAVARWLVGALLADYVLEQCGAVSQRAC